MDLNSADMPPIPTRVHHHSRRRSLQGPSSSSAAAAAAKRASLPPASPEVISNLITSLSVISKPANSHFEASPTSLSLPASPGHRHGSFGVDYGAFHQPSLDDLRQEPVSLDELAAFPGAPGAQAATTPAAFAPSSATAPPGPRNLSIERRSAPTPELHHQRSHDSWGKKTSRSQKGLMYMSSKERLREREVERKRASGGMSASSSGALAEGSVHSGGGGRSDPFFAETAIHEEPPSHTELPIERAANPMNEPYMIPARDSSLRKTGQAKRSSARRSRREEGPVNDVIPEAEEHHKPRETGRRKQGHTAHEQLRSSTTSPVYGRKDPSPSKMTTSVAGRSFLDVSQDDHGFDYDDDDDDGAPFPAVSQNRRRDQSNDRHSRRRSGHQSPVPPDGVKMKRSSSRLKRLSNPLSPRPEEQSRESPSPQPTQNPIPTGYERPQSADSVDDAVESYLCSPRLSQKIRHPQTGRVISFSEVGDSEGSAVFCCVGMGLTRYITAFYDELALTLKLRLITPDRPGVGDSEPYSDGTATPLSWPDDVYAICQALKITKFSILAHSAGAIYALATALRMPQHIRGRIHLLAPWIPPSQMNVFGTSQTLPPTNAIPTSQRILRALPTPILKAANSSFMTATSSSITSSLPKNPRRAKRRTNNGGRESTGGTRNVTPSLDKENIGHDMYRNSNLHGEPDLEPPNASENMDRMHPPQGTRNPETAILAAAADAMADKERQMTYDMRLTHAIWELATTGANPAVDLLVCLERRHTIGFRYVDITRPVVIHHGSRDTRVPVDNVKWLGKTMRRCEVRVLEGEGHGLMASASVMGSVLMEMSKEWEDWMKVTGADGRKERERGRRTLAR
ncbi:hypothetical protein ACJ41O_015105 [Fusarium nematophilum]